MSWNIVVLANCSSRSEVIKTRNTFLALLQAKEEPKCILPESNYVSHFVNLSHVFR